MTFAAKRFQLTPALDAAARDNPAIARGATGDAVLTLQQGFIDLGFKMPRSTTKSPVPDGAFGAETEAAVKSFQGANNLKADGIVGRDTLAVLDRIFSAREAAARARMVAEANAPAPFSPWYVT